MFKQPNINIPKDNFGFSVTDSATKCFSFIANQRGQVKRIDALESAGKLPDALFSSMDGNESGPGQEGNQRKSS
jgi:hypothetical protein